MIEEEVGPKAAARDVRLEVISFDTLLVDVARQYKANLIIRGLRSAGDFEYETQMTAMNRAMAPKSRRFFCPHRRRLVSFRRHCAPDCRHGRGCRPVCTCLSSEKYNELK